MLFVTHMLFSILVGVITLKLNIFSLGGKLDSYLFLAVVILGGCFSDIDHPDSKLGSRMRLISRPFNILFGHRGFTHSLIFGVIVFSLIFFFTQTYAYAFLIGFLGHLVMDALTKEGVPLLSPLSDIRLRGFFHTAGLVEMALGVIMGAGLIYLLI